jgi:transposase-like protein/IS1 family transposase
MTLNQLLAQFPDETTCKQYLVQRRWPNGVTCPKCGNTKVFHVTSRPFHWVCKKCNRNGYRFSVIAGTIFENTNYPLREWFKVIFLIAQSKKGMSALQIHRMLGTGSYETAWYMCHRIRAAMKNTTWDKLMGTVEVDETFIGGKDKNRHWDKRTHAPGGKDKTGVVGAISRKGNVVCRVIASADTKTLTNFVRETVSDKVDLIATDEWRGYNRLDKQYPHDVVKHGAGEYVRGAVHTNTLDNFWSLLKRGVVGTYHQVSKKYLPLYLAEFSFRYNHRKNTDIFGSIVAGC